MRWYSIAPSKLPLPTPSNLEFQSAWGGNHNSKWISESVVGLIVPVTRQNGTLTVIFGPAVPRANVLNGGRTNSADCIDNGLSTPSTNAAHVFWSEPLVPVSAVCDDNGWALTIRQNNPPVTENRESESLMRPPRCREFYISLVATTSASATCDLYL